MNRAAWKGREVVALRKARDAGLSAAGAITHGVVQGRTRHAIEGQISRQGWRDRKTDGEPMRLLVTSHVRGEFFGWHDKPFGERLHAHFWAVRLHYRADEQTDGRKVKKRLDSLLAEISGRALAEKLGDRATNEGIGCWVANSLADLNVVKVEVWREAECLGATVEVVP